MNATPRLGVEEARAVGLLQELACMCDETRQSAATDPARISVMLDTFEETLALLAPLFERLGASPGASRDAVLASAHQALQSHQALIDVMLLELDRLGRAIVQSDNADGATRAYAGFSPRPQQQTLNALG